MTDHTPGPWEWHHQKIDSIDYEWSLQTPTQAFLLFDFSPTISPDECAANSSLIAAAPEMLAALKDAIARADQVAFELDLEGLQRCPESQAIYDQCVAAITKAEGKT
jgi:hypothetical protein